MNKGYLLFQEGDAGNFFYIVKEGELQLNYSNGESKKFNKGDTFGELALIQKNIRSSSVVTLTDVEIYCLEGDLFKEIVLKMDYENLKERIKILSHSSFFKYFDSNKIHDIAKQIQKFEFEKGEIFAENQINNCLLIITQGSFTKFPKDESDGNKFEKFFGLSNLIFSDKNVLNFNLIADKFTICYRITKTVLFDVLGENFLKKILQNMTKANITRIKMLKLLSGDDFFEKFFGILKPCIYNKDEILCSMKENSEERKFFMILEGQLFNVF